MATLTEPGAPTSTSTTSSDHPFTCNTCLIAFRSPDPQRVHMRSDWHRYNLKRRIASLPPLTSEIFNEKVLANQAATAATAARANFEKTCPACSRTYYSENAFSNHLGSQKHKARLEELARGHKGLGGMEDSVGSLTTGSFSLGTPVGDVISLASNAESASEAGVVDDDDDEVEGVDGLVEGVRKANLKTASDTGDDSASNAPSSQAQVASGPEACLFCTAVSPSLDANVVHMRKAHGLFIPEPNYLVDLEGLISWLHERVDILHECLYCGIVRHTAVGIKGHMRDKGHCKIAFEDEEQMVEVGEFYDFSSTYSDDEEQEDEDWEDDESDDDDETAKRNPSKLGASRAAATTADADGDGEEWEDDDDDDDSSDEDMPGKTSTSKSKRRAAPRPVEPQSIYHDEDGLHLPSGRIAGHRSLARYFRQNLRTYPTPEERTARLAIADGDSAEENHDRDATPKPRGRQSNALVSRANGGLGMVGVSEAGKREARKLESKELKRQERAQKRWQWGNERRNNFQKHYRDPLLQ